MDHLDADEIVALASQIQTERDELAEMVDGVADSVLDPAPDGMTVAYLEPDLLRRIRSFAGRRLGGGR